MAVSNIIPIRRIHRFVLVAILRSCPIWLLSIYCTTWSREVLSASSIQWLRGMNSTKQPRKVRSSRKDRSTNCWYTPSKQIAPRFHSFHSEAARTPILLEHTERLLATHASGSFVWIYTCNLGHSQFPLSHTSLSIGHVSAVRGKWIRSRCAGQPRPGR